MKRPAFQFYVGDWRKDAALRMCSLAARGLWIDMLAIMHECEPYGHLTVNGGPMSDAQLARIVGEPAPAIRKLVGELRANAVFSEMPDGTIYSRRMVRDEVVVQARRDGGQAGAGHGSKGAAHGAKGGRPRKDDPPKNPPPGETRGDTKPPSDPPLKPPPSSSSSSSEESAVGIDPVTARIRKLSMEVRRRAAMTTAPGDGGLIREWLALGADPERHIFPTVDRLAKGKSVASFRYFDSAIREAVAAKPYDPSDPDGRVAAALDGCRMQPRPTAEVEAERRWREQLERKDAA